MPPDDADSPGWYPDPNGRPVLRWWDGSSWTDRVSMPSPDEPEAAAPPAAPAAAPGDTAVHPVADAPAGLPGEGQDAATGPVRRATSWRSALARTALGVVAAIVIVIGSFLPWLNLELPTGADGETTGVELSNIPSVADVDRSDPRPVEGDSYASADALAQALTAGGFPCALLVDPVAIAQDAPFVARGACGPPLGPPEGTTAERAFAAATPKFTLSATEQDNETVVQGYLEAVDNANEGPGLRGFALLLYGPNWSMSSPNRSNLVKAQAAIGGTIISSDVDTNPLYVADLFRFGFFTGLTTLILGIATAVCAAVFLLAVAVARRSGHAVPRWRAIATPFVLAGIAGAVGLNWISWIARGDTYDDASLQSGFLLVTVGALLAGWAFATFVTFGGDDGGTQPA